MLSLAKHRESKTPAAARIGISFTYRTQELAGIPKHGDRIMTTAYQLNEYLDKRYGTEIDEYALEESAISAIEDDNDAMWEVLTEFTDTDVVIGLTRGILLAQLNGNDLSLTVFAKSLAHHLKEAAIKRERTM